MQQGIFGRQHEEHRWTVASKNCEQGSIHQGNHKALVALVIIPLTSPQRLLLTTKPRLVRPSEALPLKAHATFIEPNTHPENQGVAGVPRLCRERVYSSISP